MASGLRRGKARSSDYFSRWQAPDGGAVAVRPLPCQGAEAGRRDLQLAGECANDLGR
jgi:hypothetical protein